LLKALGVGAAISPNATEPSLSNIVRINGFPDLTLTTSYLEEGSWYISQWMRPVALAHDVLGLEWWAAIAAVSVGLRLAVAPLFFLQISTGAAFQEHTEATVDFQRRWAAMKDNREAITELAVERRNYMKRHGLRMSYILVPTIAQLVVGVSFFWALRRLAAEAHLLPGFLEGGVASFTQLYAPDAFVLLGIHCGLPLLSTGERRL